MAMRLSGLMSGMDTESIIKQLVEAKSTKVTTAKKAQTKLSWKQDAWKDLNTKLKNLQSKFLSNMRFTSAYTKKVTKVSNPNAVSVITGENAVNGVQSLEIDKLAKTGYLTGGVVGSTDENGNEVAVNATTEICALDGMAGFAGGKINISVGGTSVDINIKGREKDGDGNEIQGTGTTISDVLSQLKAAGLNASFDAKWQRFSISSKESGAKNDFSITAVDGGGMQALSAMKLQTKSVKDENGKETNASYREYETYAKYYDEGIGSMSSLIEKDINSQVESYLKRYDSLSESLAAAEKAVSDINGEYSDLKSVEEYETELEAKNARIVELNNQESLSESEQQELDGLKEDVRDLSARKSAAESLKSNQDNIENLKKQMNDIKQNVDVDNKTATEKLETDVKDRYWDKAVTAHKVITEAGYYQASDDATKVNGQDAEIHLNGAKYTNNTNSFEINGLTFTALSETKGEEVTVTTEQDVDGIYDLVKNFLKEYNSIINEMDKLYNADSARGYEPLSDDEKEAMSDSDIEKYEKKIKDSLLRRDENLSSVSSSLKSLMSSGIDVNGKTMYLFDFGIETLSYFTAPENEKNAYHIAGDPDDASTAGSADKLKGMIASDPDTVISFFTKLSQNMYDKMSEMSKSVDGYRTFGSFYDDKKMKSDYDDYTSKIKELEKKLNDYEDKWYKKFAAMETTMAKMQQNTSAVTALLGGS